MPLFTGSFADFITAFAFSSCAYAACGRCRRVHIRIADEYKLIVTVSFFAFYLLTS